MNLKAIKLTQSKHCRTPTTKKKRKRSIERNSEDLH